MRDTRIFLKSFLGAVLGIVLVGCCLENSSTDKRPFDVSVAERTLDVDIRLSASTGNNQVWNYDRGRDHESFYGRNGIVRSAPLIMGDRVVEVRVDRNKMVIYDSEAKRTLATHTAGWSSILQCVGVVSVQGKSYLLVIKGVATYKNYSRIHVFNDEFKCCYETNIEGRTWQIEDIGCNGDVPFVGIKNTCSGRILRIDFTSK